MPRRSDQVGRLGNSHAFEPLELWIVKVVSPAGRNERPEHVPLKSPFLVWRSVGTRRAAVRELLQNRDLLEKRAAWLCRGTDQNGAGRDVGHDPGLSSDSCCFADTQMAGDCNLTAKLDEIFDDCRSGNADLGDDNAASADSDIVTDLDKIIDACPGTDYGVAGRAAVDCRVCANFYIVLDDDATELRNGKKSGSGCGKPKALLPDARAGIDEDARPDNCVAQARMSANPAVRPKNDAPTDFGMSANPATCADLGIRFDDAIWPDLGEWVYVRARVDDGCGMHPWRHGRLGVK